MQPSFKPPKDEAEFKERASKISLGSARAMIGILRKRRQAAVKSIDIELLYFKKVVDYKEKGGA